MVWFDEAWKLHDADSSFPAPVHLTNHLKPLPRNLLLNSSRLAVISVWQLPTRWHLLVIIPIDFKCCFKLTTNKIWGCFIRECFFFVFSSGGVRIRQRGQRTRPCRRVLVCHQVPGHLPARRGLQVPERFSRRPSNPAQRVQVAQGQVHSQAWRRSSHRHDGQADEGHQVATMFLCSTHRLITDAHFCFPNVICSQVPTSKRS